MSVGCPGFGVLLPPCCAPRVLLCLLITGPFKIKVFHILSAIISLKWLQISDVASQAFTLFIYSFTETHVETKLPPRFGIFRLFDCFTTFSCVAVYLTVTDTTLGCLLTRGMSRQHTFANN